PSAALGGTDVGSKQVLQAPPKQDSKQPKAGSSKKKSDEGLDAASSEERDKPSQHSTAALQAQARAARKEKRDVIKTFGADIIPPESDEEQNLEDDDRARRLYPSVDGLHTFSSQTLGFLRGPVDMAGDSEMAERSSIHEDEELGKGGSTVAGPATDPRELRNLYSQPGATSTTQESTAYDKVEPVLVRKLVADALPDIFFCQPRLSNEFLHNLDGQVLQTRTSGTTSAVDAQSLGRLFSIAHPTKLCIDAVDSERSGLRFNIWRATDSAMTMYNPSVAVTQHLAGSIRDCCISYVIGIAERFTYITGCSMHEALTESALIAATDELFSHDILVLDIYENAVGVWLNLLHTFPYSVQPLVKAKKQSHVYFGEIPILSTSINRIRFYAANIHDVRGHGMNNQEIDSCGVLGAEILGMCDNRRDETSVLFTATEMSPGAPLKTNLRQGFKNLAENNDTLLGQQRLWKQVGLVDNTVTTRHSHSPFSTGLFARGVEFGPNYQNVTKYGVPIIGPHDEVGRELQEKRDEVVTAASQHFDEALHQSLKFYVDSLKSRHYSGSDIQRPDPKVRSVLTVGAEKDGRHLPGRDCAFADLDDRIPGSPKPPVESSSLPDNGKRRSVMPASPTPTLAAKPPVLSVPKYSFDVRMPSVRMPDTERSTAVSEGQRSPVLEMKAAKAASSSRNRAASTRLPSLEESRPSRARYASEIREMSVVREEREEKLPNSPSSRNSSPPSLKVRSVDEDDSDEEPAPAAEPVDNVAPQTTKRKTRKTRSASDASASTTSDQRQPPKKRVDRKAVRPVEEQDEDEDMDERESMTSQTL
ncbi:hypothetical protein FRC07_010176, partial [Ceratobasidium sp. 392]